MDHHPSTHIAYFASDHSDRNDTILALVSKAAKNSPSAHIKLLLQTAENYNYDHHAHIASLGTTMVPATTSPLVLTIHAIVARVPLPIAVSNILVPFCAALAHGDRHRDHITQDQFSDVVSDLFIEFAKPVYAHHINTLVQPFLQPNLTHSPWTDNDAAIATLAVALKASHCTTPIQSHLPPALTHALLHSADTHPPDIVHRALVDHHSIRHVQFISPTLSNPAQLAADLFASPAPLNFLVHLLHPDKCAISNHLAPHILRYMQSPACPAVYWSPDVVALLLGTESIMSSATRSANADALALAAVLAATNKSPPIVQAIKHAMPIYASYVSHATKRDIYYNTLACNDPFITKLLAPP